MHQMVPRRALLLPLPLLLLFAQPRFAADTAARARLPETVRPLLYELLVQPNLTSLSFRGTVRVQLEVLQDTEEIVLHSKELLISRAELQLGPRGLLLLPLQVLELPALEQVALAPAGGGGPLARGGGYVLHVDFAGKLSDSFHGFYRSTYRTRDGEERVVAATHFEPTHARAAFPCFDEPAFKANFSIRVRREPRHMSLSNMPKSVELPGGLLEDRFDVSVKMSTYLVAFIVSDFLSVSSTTQHGVKISVYAAPEKIDQTEFALKAAVKLLDFYDDYFGIPYSLPKQDLAAIPDFQSGAMENWGLTTYRESGLLFDPQKSSASDKLSITMVIAHELAHQWFGNLVTMQWWNDLWLNEGFAKFMEFVSVNITNPELEVEDYFLSKCFEAMEVDALSSSHPVSSPVEDPAEIREIFDDVSYDKGACILNMLRDFLTPEVFKRGIIRYLRRYSYQNTVNAQLWESFASVGALMVPTPPSRTHESVAQHRASCSPGRSPDGLDVHEMMDTWTLQEGFPVVTVEVRGRERNGPGALRFTGACARAHTRCVFSPTDVLHLPEEVEWVKFNVDMRGYYIVHYEAGGWDALVSLLQHNHTALSSNDRTSLINNVFQLVSVDKVPLDRALDLSLYLSKETEIMPVTQGLSELVPLYKLMEKRDMEDVENQLKAYIVNLFRELIERQSWSDEGSVSQRMLRSYLLLFACVRGHAPCTRAAGELFRKWKESDGTVSVPSDVSLAVYSVGARSEEGWDFLLDKYRRSLYSSVKSRIKTALCTSPLGHKLQWILEQSLEGEVLKTQDLPYVLVSVSRNPKGYRRAWDFLRANWERLLNKFDLGSPAIAHMVTGVTGQFSTREMLEEVQHFFSSLRKETGAGLRCLQQALESIEENIRWMDKNLPLLKAWLDKRGPFEGPGDHGL
uniref:Aminopeptidase n=1 Tax=Scleropages formosus TaxID=113540 RepID=A0A8C9W2T6_SCLFO